MFAGMPACLRRQAYGTRPSLALVGRPPAATTDSGITHGARTLRVPHWRCSVSWNATGRREDGERGTANPGRLAQASAHESSRLSASLSYQAGRPTQFGWRPSGPASRQHSEALCSALHRGRRETGCSRSALPTLPRELWHCIEMGSATQYGKSMLQGQGRDPGPLRAL